MSAPEKHGLCFITADYRLAPQTRLPGIVADSAAAIAYIQSPAFAAAVGNRADATRLVVSGSSSGGYLALLAGTGVGYEVSGLQIPKGIKGIAASYPVTDLEDPFWNTKQRPVSFHDKIIEDAEMKEFADPSAPAIAAPPFETARNFFYHYSVQEYVYPLLFIRFAYAMYY
jgi:acetyl esterase/lipase